MAAIIIGFDLPVCDFCCDPSEPIVATHVCDPSEIKLGNISIADADGLWAACKKCDELINQNMPEALVKRSIGMYKQMTGLDLPDAAEQLLRYRQGQFWKTRKRVC